MPTSHKYVLYVRCLPSNYPINYISLLFPSKRSTTGAIVGIEMLSLQMMRVLFPQGRNWRTFFSRQYFINYEIQATWHHIGRTYANQHCHCIITRVRARRQNFSKGSAREVVVFPLLLEWTYKTWLVVSALERAVWCYKPACSTAEQSMLLSIGKRGISLCTILATYSFKIVSKPHKFAS